MTEVIDLGNDSDFFTKTRKGGLGFPIKVGYTTWKSAVGDEVAASLAGSPEFAFRAIRNPVGWAELRELYQWADVFLATPLVEEGFYMPGLEAMAAGAVVISSDAGGNRAYCRFGENCIEVGFEDAGGYVGALKSLREGGTQEIERLRGGGYEAVKLHTLRHAGVRF